MEGISDEVLEVARNLFNGGDIDYTVDRYGKATVDTDELPDLDTYEYAYGTTRAEILQQALDLIIKILPEVKFYDDYNNTGLYIELSDNHTLWNIEAPDGFNGDFDIELYNFFVEQAMEQFEQDTGVEIYQCGRSGRHICVSVDFDNILNYEDLRLKQAELEQQVIGEAESNCFGQADEINEGLKPDEKVAKCLSCGMKIKYRNRDVQHDAMGDYIECPNCKSTFDVDYDNTPTKKTEGYSLGDRYEVWQNYYEDGRTTTEYVMSFDNYAEAQRFASGLMQDPDCDAWVKDKEEESKKVTESEEKVDYSKFTSTNKVLSGNKGLSEKAINEMRWSLPDLFKDMTDEQKQIWEELSLRGMVMSCLIYGDDIHTSTDINAVSKYYKQPYVNEYYDTLGKDVTEEIIKQQTDYFNKGKVIQDVGTDSDGLSYNSFVEPEEESKKVTEATLSKFQTLTVDKDGNEMLLKDVSYNNACSWLEKELAKAGSKVVDTETKGNKTIIKADNKTKFEYDEDKGTLKRLEEAEDMTQVKDAIEAAVEKSDSTDLEKDQVKGSIDVLKTDEESAIEGYEDFKDETEKVADKELADAVNDQMEEIVDDEKEHIEKLDTIKSALSESKAERTADNMVKNEDKRSNDIYKYKGKEFRYDCDNAIVEYIWTDPDTNECVVIDEIGLSNDNWEDRKLRDAYLDEYIRQLDDEANRLADDFISNEYLGESLNQKINRKLQESREKFDRDELVAVKDSIDTALDDLQIQSDGTTGAMADKVLVNDLRSVSQSVGNYLNKVQEGKDLKHPELNNSVKAYYADSFGKDELNSEIKEVTFLDLYRALKNKQDVYDLIGVRDSVVRERLFAELARILNQPTAYVNNIWQYGVEDGQPNIVKEDKETGTIKQSLNTGVLPIVNVDLYSLYSSGWFDNLVLDDDSNAKFDEIIQDIAPRFIKETLQDILPSVEIYATGVYHPREYNYGGDELEFDLVVNANEYNALKEKALSSDMFETYLKDNYSSRSGFISSMPDDIDEFNNADEWKQMVQVIMFALKDTALTDVNEAYLNDFSEAVNQEFPYVDVEIDNAIEELEYKAAKENITLDVDYVTNYIKEQFGNTDSYDYILDKVLSGLNLTESAKVDEAKKEELFNTDVNVNVDAGDIASGNNLDLGGLGEIASAVGLMASEENTKSDKEKLAEDSDDEIPVVNPDEQDYYDNKGYIISLYPRSRSSVSII